MLIGKGADISAKDDKGKTAWDYAQERGEQEVLDVLREARDSGGLSGSLMAPCGGVRVTRSMLHASMIILRCKRVNSFTFTFWTMRKPETVPLDALPDAAGNGARRS